MIDEKISAKGRVHIQVWNAAGELLRTIDDDNLIVNVGKQSLARLLGAGTTTKRVNKIGWGIGASDPAGGNTSLTSPFIKTLAGTSYSGNSVVFEYILELSEMNGVSIREFGLFSADNTMFSRMVRSAIEKTADIRLTGTWTITF